jgi:hypothetical protein
MNPTVAGFLRSFQISELFILKAPYGSIGRHNYGMVCWPIGPLYCSKLCVAPVFEDQQATTPTASA